MLTEVAEVRVLGQPLEIAVSECQGPFEGLRRSVNFAVKGVTARQVVEDQWIARLETGQLLVNSQAVIMFSALAIVVSQYLQGLDILRVAADQPLEKGDLDIEFARLLPGQRFVTGTGLLRHTTTCIVPKGEAQVKCPPPIRMGARTDWFSVQAGVGFLFLGAQKTP